MISIKTISLLLFVTVILVYTSSAKASEQVFVDMEKQKIIDQVDSLYDEIVEIEMKLLKKKDLVLRLKNELKEKAIVYNSQINEVLLLTSGIVATIINSRKNIIENLRIENFELVATDLAMINGLMWSARESFLLSEVRTRMLSKGGDKVSMIQEKDKNITASYDSKDDVGSALGLYFLDDGIFFNDLKNFFDTAGNDTFIIVESISADSDPPETITENEQILTVPPVIPVSGES